MLKNLFPSLLRLAPLPWQRILSDSRRGLLTKVMLIIHDGLTKELCIGAYLFSREVIRLRRKSGALYLKQCASSLQKAYGGTKSPPDLLPFPVSLTRSGYPRIIPRFHRRMIYRRDDKADMLVKIYLSFLTVGRIIPLAKKVSRKTYESIITPRYRPGCHLCVEGEGSNPNPLPSESPFYPVHTPGTGYDLGTYLEGPSHSFVGGISQGP